MLQNILHLLQILTTINTKGEADILRQLSKLSYDIKAIQSAENLYNQFQELIMQQEGAQLAVKEATRAVYLDSLLRPQTLHRVGQ